MHGPTPQSAIVILLYAAPLALLWIGAIALAVWLFRKGRPGGGTLLLTAASIALLTVSIGGISEAIWATPPTYLSDTQYRLMFYLNDTHHRWEWISPMLTIPMLVLAIVWPGTSGPPFQIKRSLTFLFADPSWPMKIGLSALCLLGSCLMVPGLFFTGFLIRTIRHTIHGKSGLPEFDDPQQLLLDGVQGSVITAIWMTPFTVFYFLSNTGWPVATLGELAGLIFMMTFLPIALLRFAVTDRFSAAFELGPIVTYLRQVGGTHMAATLFFFVVSLVSGVGMVLFCVGYAATLPMAALIIYHQHASIYRESGGFADDVLASDAGEPILA